MKKIFIRFSILISLLFLTNCAEEITQKVDPFIGTGGHGHIFPGAVVPFGMVQLSPDTDISGWDWCSGYHNSDSSIMGFSHTHLSGTGASDFGDILLMPTTGDAKLIPGSKENPDEGYRSRFSHSSEKASPGYYSVVLEDYKIKAELTATNRTGFHRYTFPASDHSNIIIDLEHGISDRVEEGYIKIVNSNKIEGYRKSRGWARNQIVYFAMEFSKPFEFFGTAINGSISVNQNEALGKSVKAYVSFKTSENEQVLVKVGISAINIEGAWNNLETENPSGQNAWEFEKIRNDAKQLWKNELSKIQVEGGTESEQKIFYTALYHSFIHPSEFSDADGQYRGMDNKIYKADGFNYYNVFSLWDTYRALHPLFTIVEQKRDLDMIKTLIKKYDESGMLPVWELWSNETGTMIGYHSIPVIFDAYAKGIHGFDVEKAFNAMKNSADADHLGLESYKKLGYVASDLEHESVSKTLEYAYDDWCIAMMANDLGKTEDYERFSKRAMNYKNLFDGKSGFMRGKNADGSETLLFNPFAVTKDFTEANSWQYSLYAPHDAAGLEALYGSSTGLEEQLDETFSASSKLEGRELSDISGLIGQYAHGNEPSHHMVYLYNYTQEPWKAQKLARKIMDELYTALPDGLSGNEDCGQMSAWYVLSAMGIYPVCPGTNQFVIGSPIFDKVTLKLENGKEFTIETDGVSAENYYIQSVKLNGKTYTKNYINFNDIMNGGKVVFEMGNEPNKDWGIAPEDQPYSFTKKAFISPPYSKNDVSFFDNSIKIELASRTDGAEIYYTLDGSQPTENSELYTGPFEINTSKIIKAAAFKSGKEPSTITKIKANKLVYQKSVNISNPVNGINYKYYEGRFSSVSGLLKAKPVKSGTLEDFSVSPMQREDYFGFKFTGYINVPASGVYKFYTKSDDGSVLNIDGKRVVSNDGFHSASETVGICALKKGYHKFEVLYFEGSVDNSIEVSYEGPGIEKQKIPASELFREK